MEPFIKLKLENAVKRMVDRLALNLAGRIVVTECATGAYASTPLIAGLAGAELVLAYGRDSTHGSFADARDDLLSVWSSLNLDPDRLIATDSDMILDSYLCKADIVTNSGHLRPLDETRISKMKNGAVIPLMYEAWEFRYTDISLDACRQRRIPVAGTNERHPGLDVFHFLGPLTARALFNAGVEIYDNKIVLVCDNDFGKYIEDVLRALGARVVSADGTDTAEHADAIVFAHTPPVSGGSLEIREINLPTSVPVCCQVWGDIERDLFQTRWIPDIEPRPGHMGLQLSDLGIEPVVRLQAGGLKVGQVLAEAISDGASCDAAVSRAVDAGIGQAIVAGL